jgi:PKD repeat protein
MSRTGQPARMISGLAAGCLIGALVVTPFGAAQAYDAVQSKIVTDNPADWTPDVVSSGDVRYLAQTGDTMVAVGEFTRVENHGSSTTLSRTNIFSFSATTGLVNNNFAPTLDALTYVAVISADGSNVYVGGEFKHVNGVAAVGVAEINLATGALVSTFQPALDGRVETMKLAGGKLYIGGSFTHVSGKTIARLARLDPTTGAPDTAFSATFSGVNNPAAPATAQQVTKMDIAPDGKRLVAIGNFVQVNGVDRPQVAMFDISGPTPVLVNWETDRFRAMCSSGYWTYVHDVEFSPDGSYFVVVTTGGAYTGNNQSIGCDSATRWETSATGTALQPTWIDFTGNDTLWSVAITGTAVYTGGHNRWMNNAYGSDAAGPGAVSRPGLSALDPVTGVPFTWNPTRITGVGVFDLLATDQGLWIGHDTDYVGHEFHHKLAFFPLSGGTSVPAVTADALPGDVYQAGSGPVVSGSVGICGQTSSPTSVDIMTRRHLDPAQQQITSTGVIVPTTSVAWGRVRGTFMIAGNLYTAWADGQLCVQSFNGSSMGAPTSVDLLNNKFIGELASVTGIFFSNDRIYYTMSGKSSLFSRALVPQSNIIGAVSSVASNNVTGVDFSKVGGMFLAGSRLYYVNRTDRSLNRVDWTNNAPVAGTSVPVSGPPIDSVDWLSAGLFLIAGAAPPPPPVNQPPVAKIGSSCSLLVCDFDGTASADPDGTIASYAWDFGDGATSTQAAPSHTFAVPGPYSVQLTVTDNGGLTDTATRSVSVSNATPALTFVAETHAVATGTTTTVSMPNGVTAGDALVLVLATSSPSPAAPSGTGWSAVDLRVARSLTSQVWSKVATGADVGASVTLTTSATAKSTVALVAYRGAATPPITAFADRAETTTQATHTTPTLTVPSSGGWVLSLWAEKSSTTTQLAPPPALTTRLAGCGSGGGHTCLLVSDSAANVSAGSTAGGLTATADSAGLADTMWTLVLAPA